jgi:hypothetical protein
MVGADVMLVHAERGEVAAAEHAKVLTTLGPLLLGRYCVRGFISLSSS